MTQSKRLCDLGKVTKLINGGSTRNYPLPQWLKHCFWLPWEGCGEIKTLLKILPWGSISGPQTPRDSLIPSSRVLAILVSDLLTPSNAWEGQYAEWAQLASTTSVGDSKHGQCTSYTLQKNSSTEETKVGRQGAPDSKFCLTFRLS